MYTRSTRRRPLALVGAATAFFLVPSFVLFSAGCGGGGSSSSLSTPVTLDINWAARTRAVSAPASALSVVVSLSAPSTLPSETPVTLPPVNRADDPAAYSQKYVSPIPAGRVGQARTLNVTFFAEKDGKGSIVATASRALTVPIGGDLGDVDTVGTIASVSVPEGQSVAVGQSAQLTFSALDGIGNALAVSPGSARFVVGEGVVAPGFTLSPDGNIVGQAISSSVVTVSVDDKTSALIPVSVTIGPLVTSASGLQYQEMALGTGAAPQAGQTASVRYVGKLTDGTVFDQGSFSFKLSANQVIPGFDEGVLSIKAGGKRRLIIPPALGYGNNPPRGSKIPPGATLIFDVELVSVQ